MGSPTQRSSLSYRADIDGLRALAVLSVLAYHIQPTFVPGGFVGVDVFFVISGYLITRIIRQEIESGTFSFAAFYMRRVRRIAPASLLIVALTLAAGCMLLLPEDLKRLADSSTWSLVGLSNLYFWLYLDTSYFADASDEEPLLHTWSLGVEEQFYLLWPALLLLSWRIPRWRTGAFVAFTLVAVAAFALAEATLSVSEKFAFYMLPSRAGELLTGALLALVAGRYVFQRSPMARHLLASAGVFLLGYSFFGLDSTSSFPGLNVLPATLGTAALLVLGVSPDHIVTRGLSLPPIVYIGRISYSLYLVHWPVLAFYRYLKGSIEPIDGMLLATISILLATLSYRFVETPARVWRTSPGLQLVSLFILPVLSLGVLGALVVRLDGFLPWGSSPLLWKEEVARVEKETTASKDYAYSCQLSAFDATVLQKSRCVTGSKRQTATGADILLWGDSMAAHYVGALSAIAEKTHTALRNATHSACPPVFFGDYGNGPYREGCRQFRPYVREAISRGHFNTVAFGANWSRYASDPKFHRHLIDTIDEITGQGIKVIILGEVPRFPSYSRECELRQLRLGGETEYCRELSSIDDSGPTPYNETLAAMAAEMPNVEYLDARGIFCSGGRCMPYLDERPAYYDPGHLSMDGSWRLGRQLLKSDQGRSWLRAISSRNP